MSDTPLHDAAGPTSAASRWAAALEGDKGALRDLAGAYWYPAYVYFRASGSTPEWSHGQVESLLSRLLRDPLDAEFAKSEPTFRATLFWLAQQTFVEEELRPMEMAIDGAWAEERFAKEPEKTPEALFHRRWVLTILEFTLALLEGEYVTAEQQERFQAWQQFLGYSDDDEAEFAESARELSLTFATVRAGVIELRKRYREILQAQILDTVVSEYAAQEEHKRLMASL